MHPPSALGRLACSLGWLLVLCGTAQAEVIVTETRPNSGAESDFQRARASWADAKKAMKARRYKSALTHAEAAYRAYPNASTALSVMNVHARTKNHRKVFEWALRARNHDPTESYLATAEAALRKHGKKAKLGVLQVTSTPSKATVTLQGTTFAAGAFVGVSVGPAKLVVTAEKHEPATRTLEVAAGGIQSVAVALKAIPVEPPKTTPTTPTEKPDTTTSTVPKAAPKTTSKDATAASVAPLALLISGVVVAGVGGGLHGWGAAQDADASALNGNWPAGTSYEASRETYKDLRADGEAGAYAAFALYGVGAVLITTGAILWALDAGDDEAHGSADVVVAPALVTGGGAVTLGGRF